MTEHSERYWEARWRTEKAHNDALVKALARFLLTDDDDRFQVEIGGDPDAADEMLAAAWAAMPVISPAWLASFQEEHKDSSFAGLRRSTDRLRKMRSAAVVPTPEQTK